MNTRLLALLLTLFASFFVNAATNLEPPPPLPGVYKVLQADGTPPIAGAEVTITIVPSEFNGIYVGLVEIDRGQGPELLRGECMTIVGGPTNFTWTNMRGHTGTFSLLNEAEWESVVTSGPNDGTVRKLSRC